MTAPILHLQDHADGAEARLFVADMPLPQRLALLTAALTALTTGRFSLSAAHVRTLHRGRPTRLAFHDAESGRNDG